MKSIKVMLISPPFTQSKDAMKRCVVPLGIAYLAAVLRRAGIDVKLLDCVVEGYRKNTINSINSITYGLTDCEIYCRIADYNPDFVGVSCLMSAQKDNAHRICRIAKTVNPSIQTLMGGCHPSAVPSFTARDPYVDHVVVGEAEGVIVDIVRGKKKGIVYGVPVDVDKLPLPARRLLPMEKYLKINMPTSTFSPHKRVTQIETSRGCPYRCVFCATTNFRGKYRTRKVQDVIDEMKLLIVTYGIEEFDILDSNFTFDRKRLIALLKEMKKLRVVYNTSWANPGGIAVRGLDPEILDLMKESGCYQLSLAVESSTPRILKEIIHKPLNIEEVGPIVEHCKKIGIDLHAFFVLGFPEQSVKEMYNDYEFAKKMDFTSASFNIINALPGSDLYKQYKKEIDFSRVDLRKANIPHPEISQDDLEKLVQRFNQWFNRSLIYRSPALFIKKYVRTFIRKPSLKLLLRMFNRQ